MAKPERVLARPLEEQLRPPAECVLQPNDKLWRDPIARMRLINLVALERDQWGQYHVWFRSSHEEHLKVLYSEVARSESQHALTLTSLVDPTVPVLERALALEQATLDTFALFAQEEPDANVRAGFEYLVPEVMEHAYHVARQLRAAGKDPETVTQGRMPMRPGRPLEEQHLASFDTIKRPYDKQSVDPLTRARVHLAGAIVRALHDDYRQLIAQTADEQCRRLFARIRAVQEAHVSFCESFLDAGETALERAVGREFAEVVYYGRYLEEEGDPVLQGVYRHHLADEIAHLHLWEQELKRREGLDPWPLTHGRQILAAAPRPLAEFIAELLDTQLQRRSKGKSYVAIGKTVDAFS